MRKFFFSLVLVLLVSSTSASDAQTLCYKFLYNVTNDGVKKKGILSSGELFYFTFNDNGSMCFLTNKDGEYNDAYGMNSYKFIGKRNGMLVFKEQSTNMFIQGQDMLLFSDDLKRLNWKCKYDGYGSPGDPGVRVFNYVSDPDEDEIPDVLF